MQDDLHSATGHTAAHPAPERQGPKCLEVAACQRPSNVTQVVCVSRSPKQVIRMFKHQTMGREWSPSLKIKACFTDTLDGLPECTQIYS